MRRSTRLDLILLAALVLVIVGVYSAYWFYVAGRIENGLLAWAQSSRADKFDVSWQKMQVTGFPVAFRVVLATAHLRDGTRTPSPEFSVPSLSASARPWNFSDWQLTASDGFTAEIIAPDEKTPAALTAQNAEGVVWIPSEGGWKLWLRLQDATFETAARVRVGSADAWIDVPPKQAQGHAEGKLAIAVAAHQVALPAPLGPLGARLDELDFAATVNGELPKGRLPDALAAWRDQGGTIELDRLRLRWDGLAATASGKVTLNEELQPTAAFSGGVQGYDEIISALVDGGRMRATDAGLARIALKFLAKTGPDGKPEVKTSFTIENGQMYLGPARLGKVPRLNWE
jgi:hypothetical protein